MKIWMHRLGWLFLLWSAGVSAMAIAALVLRMIMTASGLTG